MPATPVRTGYLPYQTVICDHEAPYEGYSRIPVPRAYQNPARGHNTPPNAQSNHYDTISSLPAQFSMHTAPGIPPFGVKGCPPPEIPAWRAAGAGTGPGPPPFGGAWDYPPRRSCPVRKIRLSELTAVRYQEDTRRVKDFEDVPGSDGKAW